MTLGPGTPHPGPLPQGERESDLLIRPALTLTNDTARPRSGSSELRIPDRRRAPAVGCSTWFGVLDGRCGKQARRRLEAPAGRPAHIDHPQVIECERRLDDHPDRRRDPTSRSRWAATSPGGGPPDHPPRTPPPSMSLRRRMGIGVTGGEIPAREWSRPVYPPCPPRKGGELMGPAVAQFWSTQLIPFCHQGGVARDAEAEVIVRLGRINHGRQSLGMFGVENDVPGATTVRPS